jgi:two-component system, NtrC family, nitrogen regulation sensor histidine kinase NtrY
MESDPTPGNGSDSASRARLRSAKHRDRTTPFERRIRVLCLFVAAPAFVLAAVLLWQAKFSQGVAWTLLGGVAFLSLIAGAILMEEIIRPLQTLANVVSSLRESDYSFRARGAGQLDALGELALEINEFADLLQSQRLGEMEASALLRCVISSMDAPVLAFDPTHRLRLVNPAAEHIFHLIAERDLGASADDLQLADVLDQPDRGILVLAGKGNPVHWMVRRSSFRQRGIPHTLLVLSDVSIALREQERDAFQRLIRVIGHEINNSLTPIKSIAGSLRSWIHQSPLQRHTTETPGTDHDLFSLDRGLKIIENRAESLNRFIQAYRQLAQLPPPALQPVPLHSLIERAVALETRVAVQIKPGSDIVLQIDPDQIEQLVINLLRNAAEAALARFPEAPSNGHISTDVPEVSVTWRAVPHSVVILIQDNGVGLINPSNLFVPFYTTKPGGSGIGLALARQICEAHGGVLQVANRLDGPGCGAEIRLPLSASHTFLPPGQEGKSAENKVYG